MKELCETVFLQEYYVKVTDQRTIIGTTTYSMADVRSVILTRREKSRRPLLLIVVGMVLTAWAVLDQTRQFVPFFFIGIVLPLGGIALYLLSKPTFAILIEGPSGQNSILRSTDRRFMQKIVESMQRAVAYREQTVHQAALNKPKQRSSRNEVERAAKL